MAAAFQRSSSAVCVPGRSSGELRRVALAFARFERLGHAFDAGGIALRGRSADIGVHDGVALKSKAVGANFSSCALGMHELNISVTPPSSRTSRSFLFRQAAPGEEDLSFRSCEHAMGPTKAPA